MVVTSSSMNAQRRPMTLILVAFVVIFTMLSVSSYNQKSATWDEPQHLTAGYTALRLGDYRVDPEHPPFLRMWAALPVMGMAGVAIATNDAFAIPPVPWVGIGQFQFAHRFLYQHNDADRLLYPARFMIVLLGIVLGVLLFSWARELYGLWPAAGVLALYTIEPNLLAHSSVVTTDLGVTGFIFGAIYFLWRITRAYSTGNLLGLLLFFALATISKFSAVLLGPLLLVLLGIRALRKAPWSWRICRSRELVSTANKAAVAAGTIIVAGFIAWAAVWASYNFRHSPTSAGSWRYGFSDDPTVRARVPVLAKVVGWMDAHRLLPNAYAQGFLLGQAKAQKRSAFLAGHVRAEGWWYFFPFAFLIKTPVALVLLFIAGVILCATQRGALVGYGQFALAPIALYVGVAMTAKLNIGLRHILPVYPFVLLLAGKAVAELLQSRHVGLRISLAVLGSFALFEFGRIYPHYLAFFNQFTGGPRNGHEYLVDSNLDWGQDLKGLKRWMDKNNVQHINLSYFGTADPAYYGIDCTHLPGAPFFAEHAVTEPRLPGYVAVSVTNLRGVYFDETRRALYEPLLGMEPVARIGYSIHVYRIDRPWW
jgi:hypothetical protein